MRPLDTATQQQRYEPERYQASERLRSAPRTWHSSDAYTNSADRQMRPTSYNPHASGGGRSPASQSSDADSWRQMMTPRPRQSGQSGLDALSAALRGSDREQTPRNTSRDVGRGFGREENARDAYRGAAASDFRREQNFPDRRQDPRSRPSPRFDSRQEGASAKSTRTPDSATDTRNEAIDLDEEAADSDVDQSDQRSRKGDRRATRGDRYAISDDVPVEMSVADLKAQRAADRAKEREWRDLEARLEADAHFEQLGRKQKRQKPEPEVAMQPRVEIPEFISVQNMAQALGQRLDAFLAKLEEEGFEQPRHDHLLDSGTSSMLAELYGFEPVLHTAEVRQDLVARPFPEDISQLPARPPIVTIMGHVDHGKTTILDYLRKANVVASEHGGITQHIGAFSVVMPVTERKITFLDTPGHAAFLDMRRRGANVTDIVVLVVAADDSVMPQTIEAINHSLQAGVQIIVAINKVDKPDADVEKVKADLTRHEVVVEDLGGDYQAIALSGKTGQGMDDLEEAIVTLSDVSDFRAETTGPAEGWIIESKVTSAGRVATVLVRRGTLRQGDYIVAGNTWARVRTLRNDVGDLVSEAQPGTPVQIDGWRGEDPTAGLEVLQADDEQHAKEVVDVRLAKTEALRDATDLAAINASRGEAAVAREKVLAWQAESGFKSRKQQRVRLRDTRTGWITGQAETGPRKVHFVIKADVAGSVEAIVAAVNAIGNNDIQANVIHSGTGMITESDIRMLATSGEVGYAISFNQPIDGTMYRLAEAADLQILDHNVIYKATDQVKEKLSAELPPLITTKVVGEAEIGQIFEIGTKNKKVKIAGCKVTNGTISRAQKVRVLRREEPIFSGSLGSLKNVKKDVSEMRKGTECGMSFENWEDMEVGDRVQCFEEMSEPRKLY